MYCIIVDGLQNVNLIQLLLWIMCRYCSYVSFAHLSQHCFLFSEKNVVYVWVNTITLLHRTDKYLILPYRALDQFSPYIKFLNIAIFTYNSSKKVFTIFLAVIILKNYLKHRHDIYRISCLLYILVEIRQFFKIIYEVWYFRLLLLMCRKFATYFNGVQKPLQPW